MRTVHTKNPRMIRIVLDELQAIKAEIEPIEIAMSDIDVTRVITTRENLTEVERYLWSSLPIPMGNAINKLREVKRAKVYNIEHPVEKREAEINKLTGDIVKLEEINVALKSLGDMGISYKDGKVIIQYKYLLKDIPYVDFNIHSIYCT